MYREGQERSMVELGTLSQRGHHRLMKMEGKGLFKHLYCTHSTIVVFLMRIGIFNAQADTGCR